jgi:hypothetical protein
MIIFCKVLYVFSQYLKTLVSQYKKASWKLIQVELSSLGIQFRSLASVYRCISMVSSRTYRAYICS